METDKSLDEVKIIAALLRDVHMSRLDVFNTRALRLTIEKVKRRVRTEGSGFLTKTLPRLGKAFDKACSANASLNSVSQGFKPLEHSKLPRFLGEFFRLVLDKDGNLLPQPCVSSVKIIRQICYLFYKYKLPYAPILEQKVISQFVKTESDLLTSDKRVHELERDLSLTAESGHLRVCDPKLLSVAREARRLLREVFSSLDLDNIIPRHGPGAVATKQRLWDKYLWSNISERIASVYPIDAYFYASLSHVCDDVKGLRSLGSLDHLARVKLVPKDSRGPRLISCEPVDFQWIQQGIMRAIVDHVENIELTKFNVFFSDQTPNQRGALLGSSNGRYATLDLNEASDRVSLSLVRLLFPSDVFTKLSNCRTMGTILPSGEEIKLQKFAPMGSGLCFPILALTVWAILTAGSVGADAKDSILVYGDDVIVPTEFSANAIELLESFGLKVNRDKSCTSGLFRESCGTDAFKGVNVTPVRLRTVWSESPSPSVYTSWIAYANSFYHRRCFDTYDLIVSALRAIYGPIPSEDMHLACPSLVESPDGT